MKLLMVGILALASLTSFAETNYATSLTNDEFSYIQVRERSMAECEARLLDAHDLVISRGKALVTVAKCMDFSKSSGKFSGKVQFHKYL